MTDDFILLETQYFPSVQYFSKLNAYEVVYMERWEHYRKGSYRNRCHIASPNGLQRLSIPLKKGKNERQSIQAVRIAYEENWQKQHWQSIQTAYGNAPFFEYYADYIAPLFEKKVEFLWDWNWECLDLMLSLVGISCEIKMTEEFRGGEKNLTYDSIHPKKHRQKEDNHFQSVEYGQVFLEKHGFLPNLSILDLLFCTGPTAIGILDQTFEK